MEQTPSSSPFRIEQTPEGRRFAFDVRAQKTVRQQKKAMFASFEIPCDEGERIGGDNTAPPPLAVAPASAARIARSPAIDLANSHCTMRSSSSTAEPCEP